MTWAADNMTAEALGGLKRIHSRSITIVCFSGDCARCPGGVTKWYAETGDEVLVSPTLASDGVGVEVRCQCGCHR